MIRKEASCLVWWGSEYERIYQGHFLIFSFSFDFIHTYIALLVIFMGHAPSQIDLDMLIESC